MKLTSFSMFAAALVASLPLLPLPAHAHINMKGALQSRGGDEKASPCDGKRGDGMVYTFAPGATITLAVDEVVPHPSYFRISFDDDGEDFVEPASILPIDKTRECPLNPDDQCGKADYCTQAGVAKGARVLWDDLDPHLAEDAKGGTWNVKLPDVECDNCTIQVLQIMEDPVHGAYCPQGSCANSAASLEDIYHRCVDIKLVKDAPSGPGVTMDPINNMGMECAASGSEGAAGAGAAGASGSAGATSSGSGGASGTATAGSSASGGSGGASAPTAAAGEGGTKTSAAAGSGASTTSAGAAGKPAASSTGAAGKPAGSSTAPKAGSAAPSTGSTTSPSTSSDGATGMTTESSGGCAVSGAAADANGASFALLSLLGLFFAGRRKRQ